MTCRKTQPAFLSPPAPDPPVFTETTLRIGIFSLCKTLMAYCFPSTRSPFFINEKTADSMKSYEKDVPSVIFVLLHLAES